ncbi:uncharacterized protein [Hetaerina americana]|uniref:uncharacterized protein n=1 Tax=Hetaerina americana TaxID=62018 RepID=UPI003A7F1BD6
MASKLAHDIKSERTEDVHTLEDIDFQGMLLPENILYGLSCIGFKKPSPIQLKAIPLGRLGFDLILEAKSGTGKTCVFSLIALEMVSDTRNKLQVLILAPTREIALQVTDVIRLIGSGIAGLKVHSFIGGTPFEEDKKNLQTCHIAVGAPGRVRHLIEKGFMKTKSIRLCVLDEADKLMESSFIKDIKYFFSVLPTSKQVIVASATMPDELNRILRDHMKSPVRVCPHGEGVAPILLGLRQVVIRVPEYPNVQQQLNIKVYALTKLLSSVSFQQCIVFSNYLTRAEGICHELERRGWPCKHTAGVLDQSERMEALQALVESRCRVLLSTDLTARGVDAPRVDLVVSLDLPNNGATYLHRIGRAGRFGSYGLAVTLAADGTEMCRFSQMLRAVGARAAVLIPEKFPKNLWDCDLEQYEFVGTPKTDAKGFEKVATPSKATGNESPGQANESPSSGAIELKVTSCSDNHPMSKDRDEMSGIEVDAADLDALLSALTNVEGDLDCIESFQELAASCESYSGESGDVPTVEVAAWTCNFGENFDRVLNRVNLKSEAQFNKRLEECRLVGLESGIKKLTLGGAWPPQPLPKAPPMESTSKSNQSTSWILNNCGASSSNKTPEKNLRSNLKVRDSCDSQSVRMKNEEPGPYVNSNRTMSPDRMSSVSESSVSINLSDRECAFRPDGCENNSSKELRCSGRCGFYSSNDEYFDSSPSQLYLQEKFNQNQDRSWTLNDYGTTFLKELPEKNLRLNLKVSDSCDGPSSERAKNGEHGPHVNSNRTTSPDRMSSGSESSVSLNFSGRECAFPSDGCENNTSRTLRCSGRRGFYSTNGENFDSSRNQLCLQEKVNQNQYTSWTLNDCDISLFNEFPEKNSHSNLKASDSCDGRSGRTKNEDHGLGSIGRKTTARNGMPPRNGDRVSIDLSNRKGSSISNGLESDSRRKERYSGDHCFHFAKDETPVSSFNQWYQQVMFNRCMIENNEYWKYMFRK